MEPEIFEENRNSVSLSRYAERGVSSKKNEVHEAISNIHAGLYPTAFCKVVEDYITGDENHCLLMHADGAGTKSAVAYMYYKETDDVNIFYGIAQDAIVMNTDDLLCVGAIGTMMLSNVISRNARFVDKEVIRTVIEAIEKIKEEFKPLGINLVTTGGETADIGDIIRTISVDVTILCRMNRMNIIKNDNISEKDIIIGLSSTGKTTYEKQYNSGIGSNGLTMARHELLCKYYLNKYPETCDLYTNHNLLYNGSFMLHDRLEGSSLTIGEALLSPTRTYVPIMKELLENYSHLIKGAIHCTGGGQTKCLRFGHGLKYIKDNLFECPPIFKIIQKESKANWREMYEVFNMGHRFELYGSEELFDVTKKICDKYNLDSKIIGHVESSQHPDGQNEVVVKSEYGTFTYV